MSRDRPVRADGADPADGAGSADGGHADGDAGSAGRTAARRTTVLATGIALAAVAGFGVVVWYAYHQGIREGSEDVALVLRAPGEVRHRPDEPGGMQVPHQDKLIYDRLTGDGERPTLERLLPRPEDPVARPAPEEEGAAEPPPAAGSGTAPGPEPASTAPGNAAATTTAAAETGGEAGAGGSAGEAAVPPATDNPGADGAEAAPAASGPAPAAPDGPPRQEAAATPDADPPPAAPAAPAVDEAAADEAATDEAAGGGWHVQIAAMRSAEAARAAWERALAQHADLLDGLALRVRTVELDDGGKYFRVQGGVLRDRAAAAELCGQLKAQGQDCVVAGP